jgi:predicted solute-binding protein
VILKVLLILSVNLNECASDSKAKSLALTCETATVEVSLDVILLSYFKKLQRLLNNILQDS